ncbi:MAG: thermostable hemolysin [Oceanicoccus sp.]
MFQYPKQKLRHPNLPDSHRFALCQQDTEHRIALEHYVAKQYLATHQARLTNFLPDLLSMSLDGEIQAVAGLKPAIGGQLFLEQYLGQNIDQTIAGAINRPIDRSSIIEIGNLVSTQAGGSQLLFIILAFAIKEAGFRWLAFTATPQVIKLLKRLSATPLFLANADADRLGKTAEAWGEYYQKKPNVMAIDLDEALRNVSENETINYLSNQYKADIQNIAAQLKKLSTPTL